MMTLPCSLRPRSTPSAATLVWLLAILPLASCGLTLGPTTEVRYVLVHPGQPIRLLESASVRGERLDGGGVATLDIGGWVAMPPDHWAVIAKELNRTTPGRAVTLPAISPPGAPTP